ncbi:hypothetical protein [Paenibacillus xylaniclasticus]|uniref:hypothetical protein n=1 Tax=Paenibacillus xylaniclasticus TaxID=588083 RepID=UPI000FD93326|nr:MULTISPECIES: hypothetical protein [Paenibacillus]GFN32517.1 hypothetical protein PCURB6_27770 [Paenibacillus curdlanolyticus]
MSKLDKIGIATFGITVILGWGAAVYIFYLLFAFWAILPIAIFTPLVVLGFSAHNEDVKTQALKSNRTDVF